nr:class I SAM-dependent methyltransferase [Chloroflexota bacterium]
MPDHLFENDRLAGLYDLFSPSEQRGDFAFYLPSIMCASSVLDIGCGTGVLLGEARARGHEGRLVGIDPATGMINQARSLSDIEWIQGDLSTKQFAQEFDLIVMTGHAFQVLIEDSEIASTLELVATALSEKGRFAFETRNPLVRGWEKWDDEYSGQVIDDTGSVITAACEVEMPVEGELIRFTHTF